SIEEQDSRHWPSYSMRGRLRYQEGNVPDALRDLSVCIRETPEDLAALKTRARQGIRASMRRWDDASRDLSAGIRMDPSDTDNYGGAVYDFGMVINRAEAPATEDYVRRACAYCCAQVLL
ncbi:unnamed protein product, partial [Sphacelaria rigidula]